MLPDRNFYAFKVDDNFDEDREDKELEEIMRIIDDSISHGPYVIKKPSEKKEKIYAYLMPTVFDAQYRA